MVTERDELRAADERFGNQFVSGIGRQAEIGDGSGNIVQRTDDAQIAQRRIGAGRMLMRLRAAVQERMHDAVRGHQLLRPCQQQGEDQRNRGKMASNKHAVQFIGLN